MKTVFVIPVYEGDAIGFDIAVESIRTTLYELNPIIVAVCDPRSNWHPTSSDAHMVGPAVHRNIRGIAWIKAFHRVMLECLDKTQATHLIKTDADVIWMHNRLLDPMKFNSFGFIRYKGHMEPNHWMGMGYGWKADHYRALHKQWVDERMYNHISDPDGAAEDVSTFLLTQMVDPNIAPIPGAFGINWNEVDERRVKASTATHCGQNYSARWRGAKPVQRALMNEAMLKLWNATQLIPERRS